MHNEEMDTDMSRVYARINALNEILNDDPNPKVSDRVIQELNTFSAEDRKAASQLLNPETDVNEELFPSEGKAKGGQSLLNSREGYIAGGLGSLIVKTISKLIKKAPEEKTMTMEKVVDRVHRAIEDAPVEEAKKDTFARVAEENSQYYITKQDVADIDKIYAYRSGGGGKENIVGEIKQVIKAMTTKPTSGQADAEAFGGTRTTREARKKAGEAFIGGSLLGGSIVASWNAVNDEEPSKKEASEFEKAFSEAHNSGEEFFMFKGSEYTTDVRKGRVEGGPSMLVPPEMDVEEEIEEEMPLDTYTPEEQATAEQVPDEEMEDSHLDFILGETLDESEQEYLMNTLESDPKLSAIFDKVVTSASEFSGEGEVEGPGTGVSDSIPARLSDGEFVVTEQATDEIGADNLQTMMDDAEREADAHGGKKMRLVGGGLLDNPNDPIRSDGVPLAEDENEEIHKSMLGANRMPSVAGSRR